MARTQNFGAGAERGRHLKLRGLLLIYDIYGEISRKESHQWFALILREPLGSTPLFTCSLFLY
jgi:hypothetical protein